MMKKLLLLTVALVVAGSVSAREPKQMTKRSEVSVSYGALPVTGWLQNFGETIIGAFVGLEATGTDWGAVTVGYNYRITPMVSVGAQAVYASGKDTITFHGEATELSNRYFSVMPNVKLNWYNGRLVGLYSRAAAGVTFMKSSGAGMSGTDTRFAFQVSALGLEIGCERIAAYAEAGLGMSGSLIVGARYRF